MGKWKLRVRPRPTKESETHDSPVTSCSKSLHRSTTWRRKKRQDAEYHQEEKAKDAARKRMSRMKLKEDNSRSGRYKRAHERELQAIRQKRYRERNKASKSDQEPQTPKDRKSYFRAYRAKKRKEMSRQKRQAIRTKDRLSKRASKIPQSPDGYAEFIDNLIEHSSPRKKTKLMERGIRTNDERTSVDAALKGVKNLFKSMKKKRTCEVKGVKSHLREMHANASNSQKRKLSRMSLVLSTKLVKKSRLMKKRSNSLPEASVSAVTNFYRKMSSERPEKRYHGKKLMTISLRCAYRRFRTEHPDVQCSWGKFAALRPVDVVLLSRQHLLSCKCPYCQNVEFILQGINKKIAILQLQDGEKEALKLESVYDVLDVVMCPKLSHMHMMRCIDSECELCSNTRQRLLDHFSPLVSMNLGTFKYNSWEYKDVSCNTRINNEFVKTTKRKRALVQHEKMFPEMLDDLTKTVDKPNIHVNLRQHCFIAAWQNEQFENLKSNINCGTVVCVMDFAQNYTTLYQDDIKATHYGKQQITIHPIPCYYRKEDGTLTRESVVMLSDDINHDTYAVSCFRRQLIEHLRSKGILVSLLIEWCDGAPSQYKNASAFLDLLDASNKLEVPIIRCFYGSEHGKGESDGESGVVKSKLAAHVIGTGDVITSAADIKKFGDANLQLLKTSHFKNVVEAVNSTRSFHVVNDISRPENKPKIATIPGTNKIHCLRSMGTNSIEIRNLACFCDGCRDRNNEAVCFNGDRVKEWKHVNLTSQISQKLSRSTSQDSSPSSKAPPTPSPQTLTLQIGSWVSVNYFGKRYPGEVLVMEDDGDKCKLQVKCMEEVERGYWNWPSKDDVHWYEKEDVSAIEEPTTKVERRRIVFSFKNNL